MTGGNIMSERTDIRQRVESTATEHSRVEEEISKVGVYTIGAVSLAIGIWGLACFTGALVSYGPLGVARGYLSAVTGL